MQNVYGKQTTFYLQESKGFLWVYISLTTIEIQSLSIYMNGKLICDLGNENRVNNFNHCLLTLEIIQISVRLHSNANEIKTIQSYYAN